MAACCVPDVWGWIQTLPPITQWKTHSVSICIHSSKLNQPSLNLIITRNLQDHTLMSVSCSIVADLTLPLSLWNSKPLQLKTSNLSDEETVSSLFHIFITDVLNYGPNKHISFLHMPSLKIVVNNVKDIFNLSFFTLLLLICIYEAPQDLRSACLNTLKDQLTSSQAREASKVLMKFLGSNIEEQWMRSLNLAITNWIIEFKAHNHYFRTPTPLYSYSLSTLGLWKVQLYCPVIAMNLENTSNNASVSDRLLFSLMYHQLEGVIQLGYKVIIRDKRVDVVVSVDNVRCDVIPLVSKTLMAERGAGAEEKYFPSHISLQLTPTLQTNVHSVSVSKSSENPTREIGLERAIEGGFDPPKSFGLKVSAAETTTLSLKPWRFEQSVYGDSANLNWFLHDSVDGREVFSSKPSKFALVQSKAWFKNRYSSAYRPFTKQGGVIFARDEYGDGVQWKVDKKALGTTMEWEIKGWIWLTYWPNKYRTLYNETRRLVFREILQLQLV